MAMAIFSFVPTPSALETSTGSFHRFRSSANSAPNPPIPPSTAGEKVLLARWRIRCLASSATAILTPASAYFIVGRLQDSTSSRMQRFGSWPLEASKWPRDESLVRTTGGRLERSRHRSPGPGQREAAYSLKHMEQSAPPYSAGVNDGVGVGQKARPDVAIPGVLGRVERHVNDHRRAKDVSAWHATPEAAVIGIFPVVAHREIAILRNLVGEPHIFVAARSLTRRRGLGGPERVIFLQTPAIDPNRSIVNVNFIAGKSDDAFHVVGLRRIKRWLEDDDLLPFGIAPERHVDIGEGDAGVVANSAHDQVIADQQRILHGA